MTRSPEDRRAIPFISAFQNSLLEAQNTFNSVASSFFQKVLPSSRETTTSEQVNLLESQSHGSIQNGMNHEKKLKSQLEIWKQNPSWTDSSPPLKIGVPPDAVYNIITDPENKRVFKNIKEVTYRNILEDDGHRQLVEIEQSAIWRFLCFSGTLSVHLYVDQDRQSHTLKYHLAKEGFMKKFEGTWEVKPVYVDAPHCGLLQNPESEQLCTRSRVASEIHFQQVVQPIVVPPPPISWYVRGITKKQTESLLEDLQAEAKRLREGNESILEIERQEKHGRGIDR
ncbi:hypothetical protein KP509_39G023000 [Ceratopteris richardii]|uniref:DUF220 domain-containing protein n=1 Tax=Ceratopteris richardii TaxID=49495 RepID=A0A8T2PZM9_CERRI|nr:hypothetical protein KP509_39G023000 [Ceratopteris richardii]